MLSIMFVLYSLQFLNMLLRSAKTACHVEWSVSQAKQAVYGLQCMRPGMLLDAVLTMS
jgi:hypothetical protein